MGNVKYTKEVLEKLVKESFSTSEVARRLGLRTDRGFVTYLKKLFNKFEINFEHFKSKSQQISERLTVYPIEYYLSNRASIKSHNLRIKLFNLGIKKEICEECGISDWHGRFLSFNLHHIDSNPDNNNIENLKIVCPNCHYCIHNEENQKKKKEKPRKEIAIGNKVVSRLKPELRKVERPKLSVLKKEVLELGYKGTGKKYGVIGNTVKKWIKTYEKYGILD